jgi:hypothetical protein
LRVQPSSKPMKTPGLRNDYQILFAKEVTNRSAVCSTILINIGIWTKRCRVKSTLDSEPLGKRTQWNLKNRQTAHTASQPISPFQFVVSWCYDSRGYSFKVSLEGRNKFWVQICILRVKQHSDKNSLRVLMEQYRRSWITGLRHSPSLLHFGFLFSRSKITDGTDQSGLASVLAHNLAGWEGQCQGQSLDMLR